MPSLSANVNEESPTRLVPGNQPKFFTDDPRLITHAMAGVRTIWSAP